MNSPTVPVAWYIVAALTITTLLTSCGWDSTSKQLKAEKAAHASDVQRFKDTQAEANRKAEAKRKELEKQANENSKQADANYTNLLDEYEHNLMRFKANQSDLIRSYRNLIQASKGRDGSGGSTDVLEGRESEIIISLADGRICAVNTSRLQAVREWALNPPN